MSKQTVQQVGRIDKNATSFYFSILANGSENIEVINLLMWVLVFLEKEIVKVNSDMRIAQGSLGKLGKEQIISLQALSRASLTDIIHTPLELFLEFYLKDPGPFVWRPISTNPWLNFILGFFIPLFKSLYRIIFSVPFRESNYIVDKKIALNFLLKLSDLKSDLTH